MYEQLPPLKIFKLNGAIGFFPESIIDILTD